MNVGCLLLPLINVLALAQEDIAARIRFFPAIRLEDRNDVGEKLLSHVLEATLNEQPAIGQVIFLGDLITLWGTPVNTPPNVDYLTSFLTGRRPFFSPPRDSLFKIREILQRMSSRGVRVSWVQGTQELGLSQELISSLANDPVSWIEVQSDHLVLYDTIYAGSSVPLSFFSYIMGNETILPLTVYLERLLRSTPRLNCVNRTSDCPTLEDISGEAFSTILGKSASETLDALNNTDAFDGVVSKALALAMRCRDDLTDGGSVAFADGNWTRRLVPEGKFQGPVTSITAVDIIEKYKKSGREALKELGEKKVATLVYGSFRDDINGILVSTLAGDASMAVLERDFSWDSPKDLLQVTFEKPIFYMPPWVLKNNSTTCQSRALILDISLALNDDNSSSSLQPVAAKLWDGLSDETITTWEKKTPSVQGRRLFLVVGVYVAGGLIAGIAVIMIVIWRRASLNEDIMTGDIMIAEPSTHNAILERVYDATSKNTSTPLDPLLDDPDVIEIPILPRSLG